MKTIVHVNQHNIKYNRVGMKPPLPVLTVKTYKDNRKGFTAIVRSAVGGELGRFVYQPDNPLPCGAHVWFETQLDVEVIDSPPSGG